MPGPRVALPLLALVLIAAVFARLIVGDKEGGMHWPETAAIWALRMRPVLVGLLVGSALGIGGVFLQSLLRNPLASPDLVGPAAGAGLAVALRAYLAMLVGGASGLDSGGVAANGPAAMVGALAALALVYVLSQKRGFVEPVSLVLIGVTLSIVFGAVTLFVVNLLPDGGVRVSRWSVGSLSEDTGNITLAVVGAGVALGLGAGMLLAPAMDVAALGEDEARSSGVALGPLRAALFVAAGLLTAGAVVLAGPIGFVGLVCPHIVRLMAGPGHRSLIPGSALAGGALVVGADAATKGLSLGGGHMPLGVLTALIGGPVFIVLLRRDTLQ